MITKLINQVRSRVDFHRLLYIHTCFAGREVAPFWLLETRDKYILDLIGSYMVIFASHI